MHLSQEDIRNYFEELYGRRNVGDRLKPKRWTFANGEVPEPGGCHANVDRWIAENPGHKAIRGWVLDGEMGECVNFVAHSAVGMPSGELVDITFPKSLSLISHRGSPEFFQLLRQSFPNIFWPALQTFE